MPNLGVPDVEAVALVVYLGNVSRQMTARADSGTGGKIPPTPNPQ